MKKSLFVLLAGVVLAGSVLAQTASPAVNAAASKAASAPAAVTNAAKSVNAPAVAPAAAPATQAAASSAGKVWVNGKVYHCSDSKYFGKTKKGEYMSEAEAKAKGAHGVKGQTCH